MKTCCNSEQVYQRLSAIEVIAQSTPLTYCVSAYRAVSFGRDIVFLRGQGKF